VNVQSWTGYDDPRFGYGSMFHGFRGALPKTVMLDPKGSVNVHMSVPNVCKGWFAGQHRVLFSMWETDRLPDDFRNWLGQYDQVLVPCDHNAELFGRFSGDVSVVPLGVDRKVWSPRVRPDNEVFRFAAGGSLWRRKGLDIVVEAFNRLKLHNAELHIKAAPHARDTPTKPLGDNIVLHREWMTVDDQVAWFNEADCYVAVSRGEGFGLMPLQAIALGVPNIVSLTTGQTQFAGLATYTVTCGKSPADTVGVWDEPNLGEVMDAMLDAYRNRDRNNVEARKQAAFTSNWTWGKATKRLLDVVPVGTLLENPGWITPNVEVDIRVKRRVNATIHRSVYNFVPGVSYRVPENVFQVLSASDSLEEQ
jgi:glycosyltransferase involved in cell wall biosynthesis